MASLREAIAAIQAHAITAGAREAPVDPPESNVGFPFAVCYPNSGLVKGLRVSARVDTVDLFLDVHLSRQNLPLNVQAALSFWEKFPDLIIEDNILGGTVENIDLMNAGMKFVFGNMSYAGIDTIGFRFTIQVKIRRSL